MGLTFPVVFGLLGLVGLLQVLIGDLAASAIGVAIGLVVLVLMERFDIGSDPGLRSFRSGSVVAGVLGGLALASAVTAFIWALGFIQFSARSGTDGKIVVVMISVLLAALFEEILFRSICFFGIEPVVGSWLTLATSAVVFGGVHAFNPGAGLVSTVAIVLTAGLLLGAVFLLTRSLWVVTGVHFGWNACIGLLGLGVSGSARDGALFTAAVDGPSLLTGGAFGPEASVVTIVVVGGAGVLAVSRARAGAGITPPLWSR